MNNLDKYDLAILQELQADARLTNAELAQRVGLSAAPCWRRVRALEEAGYIKGYHAEIDRRRIGLGVLAFVRLDADRNTGGLTLVMEEAIRQIPEVVSCHYISGTGTFEFHRAFRPPGPGTKIFVQRCTVALTADHKARATFSDDLNK